MSICENFYKIIAEENILHIKCNANWDWVDIFIFDLKTKYL